MATWSPLTNKKKESKHNSGKRTYKVTRITPHCWVGQVPVENGLSYFASTSRQVSSNYIIGSDGRVGGCVREEYRAWTSSSRDNDNRAITIECASGTKSPYAFKSAVYNKLISLCVDICKRYGKKKLLWISDKKKALAYTPKNDEMLLTVHRWFAATDCPGSWLMGKMPDLAKQVTAKLQGKTPTPTPAPKPKTTKYKVTAKSGLRLRKLPNTKSAILTVIPYGTTITVDKTQSGWAHTTYKGKTGWCSMQYLKKV